MKNLVTILGILIFSFTTQNLFAQNSVVKWYSIEEAEELMKNEPRKLFIDVYTDWCGWCKKMDYNTFQNPAIAKILNESYYPVKLDAEGRNNITFKGHTFKFVPQGNKGYHELAAALMNGKMSYPTVVFMDENLNVLQPLPGYQSPESLKPILQFIGEDIYKSKTWQEYTSQNNE